MAFKLEQAKPHTIKKFEVISNYVDGWARKILGYDGKDGQSGSKGIIYIDCMSNAGMYTDEFGVEVKGTVIRVAETISKLIENYPDKNAVLIFNDYDQNKINTLESYIKSLGIDNTDQFQIVTKCGDKDEFLKSLTGVIQSKYRGYNILLLYDPYMAALNWEAITPYLNMWGEVIINHMVSDTERAAKQVKKDEAKEKYQETYQEDIEKIIELGVERNGLEQQIHKIIKNRASQQYDMYIASFPFFTRKNRIQYNLIFCTHSVKGIKLFKQKAWDAFGGKSSMKKKSTTDTVQLMFNLDMEIVQPDDTDEDCYTIKDVAKYIMEKYGDRDDLNLKEVYEDLDTHPVFPSDGYKNEIKKELKERYKVEIKRDNTVVFNKE